VSTPHLDKTRTVDVPQEGPPPDGYIAADYEEWFEGADGQWYIRLTLPPGVPGGRVSRIYHWPSRPA